MGSWKGLFFCWGLGSWASLCSFSLTLTLPLDQLQVSSSVISSWPLIMKKVIYPGLSPFQYSIQFHLYLCFWNKQITVLIQPTPHLWLSHGERTAFDSECWSYTLLHIRSKFLPFPSSFSSHPYLWYLGTSIPRQKQNCRVEAIAAWSP